MNEKSEYKQIDLEKVTSQIRKLQKETNKARSAILSIEHSILDVLDEISEYDFKLKLEAEKNE